MQADTGLCHIAVVIQTVGDVKKSVESKTSAFSNPPPGLQTPPQCELVVGGEPQCWSEGHCLLVDDSFLHTVSHNGESPGFPIMLCSSGATPQPLVSVFIFYLSLFRLVRHVTEHGSVKIQSKRNQL